MRNGEKRVVKGADLRCRARSAGVALVRMFGLGAILLAGAALGGCKSLGEPASASFASVKIGGHTRQEVVAATIKVFEDAGYQTFASGGELVFEREGSRWDQIAYGDLVGNEPVINRVRAQVVELGGGVFRVQCSAYAVRHSGSMAVDEVRLRGPRSGPYRALLDKVVWRLTEEPAQQARAPSAEARP